MSQRERKGSLCPAAREALGRPSSGCNSTGPTPSDEGQGPLSEIRADDIVFKVPKCRLCGLVTQVSLTLCKSLDCSLTGSLVHGISQAKILEWVAISYSRGSSQPRDRTRVSCFSCIGRQILYHCTTWEAFNVYLWQMSGVYSDQITVTSNLEISVSRCDDLFIDQYVLSIYYVPGPWGREQGTSQCP